jgi:predicted nuclease of predicted toxin-antitoxin system
MRLLVDENYPPSCARALSAAGHDVACISEVAPSIADHAVLALARSEGRVLVTFDSDFGDLVFLRGQAAPVAIILIRLHPVVLADVTTLTLRALDAEPLGAFVVSTPNGLRKRLLP